jgi:hypothetical protein
MLIRHLLLNVPEDYHLFFRSHSLFNVMWQDQLTCVFDFIVLVFRKVSVILMAAFVLVTYLKRKTWWPSRSPYWGNILKVHFFYIKIYSSLISDKQTPSLDGSEVQVVYELDSWSAGVHVNDCFGNPLKVVMLQFVFGSSWQIQIK